MRGVISPSSTPPYPLYLPNGVVSVSPGVDGESVKSLRTAKIAGRACNAMRGTLSSAAPCHGVANLREGGNWRREGEGTNCHEGRQTDGRSELFPLGRIRHLREKRRFRHACAFGEKSVELYKKILALIMAA